MHTDLNLYLRREELYESPEFPERELAALVTSKVYYHLQEYDESMVFALGAANLFDITAKGEYVETMICLSSMPCHHFSSHILAN